MATRDNVSTQTIKNFTYDNLTIRRTGASVDSRLIYISSTNQIDKLQLVTDDIPFNDFIGATFLQNSYWQGLSICEIEITDNGTIYIYSNSSTVTNYGTIEVTLTIWGK